MMDVTPAPRCDFDWRPHWDAFTARMAARATATGGVLHAAERAALAQATARLAQGEIDYGDAMFRRSPAENRAAAIEEAVDFVNYMLPIAVAVPRVADAVADLALAALALVAALGRIEVGE